MKTHQRLLFYGGLPLVCASALILWPDAEPRSQAAPASGTACEDLRAADGCSEFSTNATPFTLTGGHPAHVTSDEPAVARVADLSKLDAFDEWVSRWVNATPSESDRLAREGEAMAVARRMELKALIASNPQLALERAVPRAIRHNLPPAVLSQLETPVSAEGEFVVKINCSCADEVREGAHDPTKHESSIERTFVVAGKSYRASVPSALIHLNSRKNAPLHGVAVDDELAVAANAVRPIELGERIPAGVAVEALDGQGSPNHRDTQPDAPGPVVEVGGRLFSVGSQEEIAALQEDFNRWVLHEYDGSNSPGFFQENFPNPSDRRVGNYRILYIPIRFADRVPGYTEKSIVSNVREVERIYSQWSYGRMVCNTTITAPVTMPFSWASVQSNVNAAAGNVTDFAKDYVGKLGYDPGQYDTVFIHAEGFGGSSWDRNAIGGGLRRTILHEVGHQLGAWHAAFWPATDGTGYGFPGANNDTYGNPFDIMGNYGISDERAHFSAMSKIMLGWLAPQDVHRVNDSGVFRIYAFDQPLIEQGKQYALVVGKDRAWNYYLEYRPAIGGLLADSAMVHLGNEMNEPRLVDTTPHTPDRSDFGKRNCGIAVGRTFSDLEADMHFTVISKNATTPPSLDIVYKRGPFPGNQAPQLAAVVPSSTNIAVGGSITFDASGATDVDGDELAYHWDFGDGVSSPSSAVVSRTFDSAAQITAMVTVSDMKGGTVRRHVVVNVGDHGRQSVTGTVTLGGQPLENVYITAPGGQYTFTDRSGNYALSNLSMGSTTLAATYNGHTLTPSAANPINVVAGVNSLNWTSVASSTFVTLSKVTDATEGGQPGVFRLTRTGSTAATLVVRVSETAGSAVYGTASDYTLAPDRTVDANPNYWNFTIPAGQASLDVTVNPVNDALAEGPETLRFHLSLNGNYLPGAASAAVMTLHDNDTALPQVALVSSDPSAGEFPADTGRFVLTRTGSTASSLNVALVWSGTATNGADFALLPAVVTIPAGQSSVEVDLVPVNDNHTENIESAIATIQPSVGSYVIESSRVSASVDIKDDDLAVVSVSVPDASASETGPDSGLLLIHRTGETSEPQKVYYGVRGSALHGRDYSSLSGEVVIPAGASSAPVMISPIADGDSEGEESVILALAPVATNYGLGVSNTGTVKISDNEQVPVISVRPGVTGVEGGANPTVIFRASGSGGGNVTVRYVVSGTATSDGDFAALGGSIVVPAGGNKDTTLTIPVLDDTIAEATETVTITLLSDNGYLLENGVTADALIRDNDSGGDWVNATVLRGASPSESGPTTGSFYLSRTNAAADLVVSYAVSGTATNGVDYDNLPGTVTIPAGQLGVNVNIVPINDTLAEGIETVTLTVLPGTGYSPEAIGENTHEVIDNEVLPFTVGFPTATAFVVEPTEGVGTYHDIEVTLSAASATTVTVEVVGNSGSSAQGDNIDWTFVDPENGNAPLSKASLTYAPGVTSRTARIRVNCDDIVDPVEIVSLKLQSPRGASASSTACYYQVVIFDGVAPSADLLFTEERWNSSAVYTNGTWSSVAPSYSGYLHNLTPSRNVGDGYSRRLKGLITAPTTGSYTFWIASDDGSKLYLSTDATAANKRYLTGVSGWSGYKSWSVQNSATVSLVAGQSYYVEVQHQESGGDDHVSVVWEGPGFERREIGHPPLPDTSTRTLRFAMETSIRTEADGGEPQLMVALDRPAGDSGVSVDYVVDGNATQGADFTLAAGSLVFAPGELVKHLPLVIHHDGVPDAPEWLRFSLTNAQGAQISAPSSHTITILDSAAPVVETLVAQVDPWMAVGTDLGGLVVNTAPSQTITSWTILSGNTGNAFSVSPAGRFILATPAALPNPGAVQLVVRAIDSAGSFGDGVVNVICNAMQNGVIEERWSGTAAYTSKAWINPSYTGRLDSLTTPRDIADQYSRRLVGYLRPATSGTYYFNIAGDDDCRLLLSTDESSANLSQIAAVSGWTTYQSWNSQPGQRSSGISLTAGVYYRIEVEQREMTGGDHVSVAWEGPGIALQAIPSSVLYTPTGVSERRWSGTVAFDTNDWTDVPSYVGTLPAFNTPENVGDNYSRRLVGYLKPSVTGNYTFWIAGDDDCRLYLSSDVLPSNMSKIAAVTGSTGYQAWDADQTWGNQTQKSLPVALVAGKHYWMEVHHKEGSGGDHVSVAWSGPGITRQLIPASAVVPAFDGVDFDHPPQAPFIALTSPAQSAQIHAGEPNTLAAMVTGGTVSVTSVEFYQEGMLVGSDSTAPYSVSWTAASTGSRSLIAKAIYSGGVVQSSPVTVQVVNPDPTADPDGDGFNTGLEFALGTNPYSSASQPEASYAGLVGWWKLNDAAGALADDYTGRPQDGAVSGATWTNGVDQGALAFDGVNDQVEVPATLLSGRSSFTLSGWFRTPTGAQSWKGLFGQNNAIELGIDNNQVKVWTALGGGLVSAPMPLVNEWHHVACVADGTTVKLYLDGVLATTGGSPTSSYGSSAYPFRIGGGVWGASGGNFQGDIDDVRVYARALSATEVLGIRQTVLANRVPVFVANPITKFATEDLAYSGNLAGDARDADSGDVLSFTKLSGPSWLGVAANGTLSGVPGNSQVGLNSFTVRVTDAAGASADATLNLTVINVNDAPVFASGVINSTATEDVPFNGQLVASDIDAGDLLTFTKVSGPAWLNVSVSGALSGTPANGDVGSNTFAVRVTDSAGAVSDATLQVGVANVNDSPVFASSTISLNATEDQALIGQLSASDVDAGDSLTFSKLSGPAWLTVSPVGGLSGTPVQANVGTNDFIVRVTDAAGASADATLTLTVTNVNDAPVFVIAPLTREDGAEGAAYVGTSLSGSATDADLGDTLAYSKTSGPAWLLVAANGTLTGTPTAGAGGTNVFTIRATDSQGAFVETQLTILVTALPLPWTGVDVGTGQMAGNSTYSNNGFALTGAGAIGGSSDRLHYTYQSLSGDGEIVAKINSLQDTGNGLRVGVMIRETLASNSKMVFMGVNNSSGFRFVRRSLTGGSVSTSNGGNGTLPDVWVKLVRVGNSFSAYKSADGLSWNQVGVTQSIVMATNCHIGLFVASGSSSVLTSARISGVSATP